MTEDELFIQLYETVRANTEVRLVPSSFVQDVKSWGMGSFIYETMIQAGYSAALERMKTFNAIKAMVEDRAADLFAVSLMEPGPLSVSEYLEKHLLLLNFRLPDFPEDIDAAFAFPTDNPDVFVVYFGAAELEDHFQTFKEVMTEGADDV